MSQEDPELLDPTNDVEHTEVFFVEHEKVQQLLRGEEIIMDAETVPCLAEILDKYQENCELLDAYIENITCSLFEQIVPRVRSLGTFLLEMVSQKQVSISKDDPCFGEQVSSDYNVLQRLFYLLYILCKVRGGRTICKFVPHQVIDLEPALLLLSAQSSEMYGYVHESLPMNNQAWHVRYGLLLWLSVLVLVPFNLETADSLLLTAVPVESQMFPIDRVPLIRRVVLFCQLHAIESGPTSEMASVVLSKQFSRADMHASALLSFCYWAKDVFRGTYLVQNEDVILNKLYINDYRFVHIIASTLRFIALLVPSIPRKRVVEVILPILWSSLMYTQSNESGIDALDKLTAKLNWETIEQSKKVDAEQLAWQQSPMCRKYLSKCLQRIGLSLLPPHMPQHWRYVKQLNTLTNNFHNVHAATVVAEEYNEKQKVPYVWYLEEIQDKLFVLVRDSHTVVRWSAAKGIGKLTFLLPAKEGKRTVEWLLLNFQANHYHDDARLHGSLLALGELVRRGLLMPAWLSSSLGAVIRLIEYDVRRGGHSIGAHVRDAACYVVWAISRAYDANSLRAFITPLSNSLLQTILFDRDINCRRAASAAYQEFVGRLRDVPYGIDTLTLTDYFALSNRHDCYTSIAKSVALAETTFYPTNVDFSIIPEDVPASLSQIQDVQYLIDLNQSRKSVFIGCLIKKLKHWDVDIRVSAVDGQKEMLLHVPGAAEIIEQAVHGIIKLASTFDSHSRHGALLCLSVLLPYYPNMSVELKDKIVQIPFIVTEKKLMDQILQRCVLVDLIGSLTTTCNWLSHAAGLLDIIQVLLSHTEAEVQRHTAAALVKMISYYDNNNILLHLLQLVHNNQNYQPTTLTTTQTQHLTSNANQLQGVARLVAMLPSDVLLQPYNETISIGSFAIMMLTPRFSLAATTAYTQVLGSTFLTHTGVDKDPLSRALCIWAVKHVSTVAPACLDVAVTVTEPIHGKKRPLILRRQTFQVDGTPSTLRSVVSHALLSSMEDFQADNRGDVGAWCRVCAMYAFAAVLDASQPHILLTALRAVILQLGERTDRVRVAAQDVFFVMLATFQGQLPHTLFLHRCATQLVTSEEARVYTTTGTVDAAVIQAEQRVSSGSGANFALLLLPLGLVNDMTAQGELPYTLLGQLLSSPLYRLAAVASLSLSIGGLTETSILVALRALFRGTTMLQNTIQRTEPGELHPLHSYTQLTAEYESDKNCPSYLGQFTCLDPKSVATVSPTRGCHATQVLVSNSTVLTDQVAGLPPTYYRALDYIDGSATFDDTLIPLGAAAEIQFDLHHLLWWFRGDPRWVPSLLLTVTRASLRGLALQCLPEEYTDFYRLFVTRITAEVTKSTQIQKIFNATQALSATTSQALLLCGPAFGPDAYKPAYASSLPPAAGQGIRQLLLLLTHRYPKVRKITSIKLLELVNNLVPSELGVDQHTLEQVRELLAKGSWDHDADVSGDYLEEPILIRRNAIMTLLNFSLTNVYKFGVALEATQKDMVTGTYAELVREIY